MPCDDTRRAVHQDWVVESELSDARRDLPYLRFGVRPWVTSVGDQFF